MRKKISRFITIALTVSLIGFIADTVLSYSVTAYTSVSAVRSFTPSTDVYKASVPTPIARQGVDTGLTEKNENMDAGSPAVEKIDWMAPSGKQPDLKDYDDLSIDVNLSTQRTTVLSGDRPIYEMVSSTGVDDSTPRGDYTIGMRGESFFNPNEQMGARWWVGFIGGTYLFHSVPTDSNGDWIVSEAERLGHPASHGCVRLTVADSEWLFREIPEGTPVHIA